MRPRQVQNGWIRGVYPSYRVQANDRFMSEIGCLLNNPGCDVTFRLDYQIPGQPVRNIGEWREVYDGRVTRLDLDLSGLAGQQVQFILAVANNGQPARADAYWFVPSIRRGGTTVTPTPTRTPTPTATTDWSSNPAVQSARNIIAQAAGVPVDQVIVVSATAVQWTDTCLGVPAPGQVCAPAIIPGYRVILRVGNQGYEAHTNQDGSIVVWFLI
jgi:hypothetical protein